MLEGELAGLAGGNVNADIANDPLRPAEKGERKVPGGALGQERKGKRAYCLLVRYFLGRGIREIMQWSMKPGGEAGVQKAAKGAIKHNIKSAWHKIAHKCA